MKKRRFILEQHRSKDTSQSISSILKLLGVIGIANVMTAFLTFSDFSFLSTLYNLEVGNILRFHPFIKSNPTYFIFILSTWNIMLLMSFFIITYAWFAFSDLCYTKFVVFRNNINYILPIIGIAIFLLTVFLTYPIDIKSIFLHFVVVGTLFLFLSLLVGLFIRIVFKFFESISTSHNIRGIVKYKSIFGICAFMIGFLVSVNLFISGFALFVFIVLMIINFGIVISYDKSINLSYRSKRNLSFYTAIAFVTVLIFAFFCSLSSDGWKRLDDTKMTVGFLSTKFLLDTKKELVVTNELDENITIHKNGDIAEEFKCINKPEENATYISKYINSPLDDKIFWYFEDVICKESNISNKSEDKNISTSKVYIVSTEDNKTEIVAVGHK